MTGDEPSTTGRAAARLLTLTLAAALAATGCASWRGARLYHSGTVALERGDVAAALSDLEAAAALVPDASEVQNNLGRAQLAAGREDLALLSFERATALDCTNVVASDNLRRLRAALRARDAEIRTADRDTDASAPRSDPEPRVGSAREERP